MNPTPTPLADDGQFYAAVAVPWAGQAILAAVVVAVLFAAVAVVFREITDGASSGGASEIGE